MKSRVLFKPALEHGVLQPGGLLLVMVVVGAGRSFGIGEGLQLKNLRLLTLPHKISGIAVQVFQWLNFARRPPYFGANNFCRLSQPDFLSQGIGSETSPAVDRFVNASRAAVFLDADFYSGANGRAVGLNALQLELDPMIRMAGVFKQDPLEPIARVGAAHHFIYVLIAIIVEVCEGYCVAFLQVAKAT